MKVPNLYAGSQIDKGVYSWHFCYLHGEAEGVFPEGNSCAPDIFASDQPMPEAAGSYPVLINGERGIAVIAEHYDRLGGRVVLISDLPALQHAARPEDWA